jgi:hypothetical protein
MALGLLEYKRTQTKESFKMENGKDAGRSEFIIYTSRGFIERANVRLQEGLKKYAVDLGDLFYEIVDNGSIALAKRRVYNGKEQNFRRKVISERDLSNLLTIDGAVFAACMKQEDINRTYKNNLYAQARQEASTFGQQARLTLAQLKGKEIPVTASRKHVNNPDVFMSLVPILCKPYKEGWEVIADYFKGAFSSEDFNGNHGKFLLVNPMYIKSLKPYRDLPVKNPNVFRELEKNFVMPIGDDVYIGGSDEKGTKPIIVKGH